MPSPTKGGSTATPAAYAGDGTALAPSDGGAEASADTPAETDAVVITSTDCKLRGSDVIERIRLNEAFRFFVRTRITWVDGSERRLATDTQIRVQVEPPGPFATVPRAARLSA